MGIFFKPAQLAGDETLIWKKLANRTQGARAVGGRLFLTDRRLMFQPNRIDAVLRGRAWSTPLTLIERVGYEDPDGSLFSGGLFSGGLRTRLRIDLVGGGTELFVVNGVDSAVQIIQKGVE